LTPLHVPVEIVARDRRVWRLSLAIDVGAIRFGKEIPFDPGTRVRLSLTLPGGAALGVEGKLASAEEIRFDAAPPQSQAIEAYLKEQVNEP